MTTDDGIIGFTPGTCLREFAPGEYLTNEGQALKLAAHEVTNDLAEARQIAGYSAAVRSLTARNIALLDAPKPAAAEATPASASAGAAARHMPGVSTQVVKTRPTTGLGATHSKTEDGWLWQRSAKTGEWVPVKRLGK